jgi:hypothetical protein
MMQPHHPHKYITLTFCFLLRAMVWIYRHSLVFVFGGRCRFMPSCSAYADEAIRIHGPYRGTVLAAKRLCRCHPWGGHGYDPVPKA